ncbi:uncharacterized protein LY79DRAFT_44264 [Colletotrichum navitas]|uniref:Uncharacterized protein n=1 Tax=Colletotrichum navitas TaxID=681940 RepID=A0AAD8PMF4_9PEZI|nr:uncharacterized protein LY79DRAFT_44264 [Colletotrichum navitas]KAK1572658.1 hypothetical protein LY79DRAFT_44264 [Colletotrichum navitas]
MVTCSPALSRVLPSEVCAKRAIGKVNRNGGFLQWENVLVEREHPNREGAWRLGACCRRLNLLPNSNDHNPRADRTAHFNHLHSWFPTVYARLDVIRSGTAVLKVFRLITRRKHARLGVVLEHVLHMSHQNASATLFFFSFLQMRGGACPLMAS